MTRTLLRMGALAAALVVGVASAQAETVWRMATKQPADSPEGLAFQKFADLVKDYSGGKMTVKVYPSEQLGKTEATLEQVQAGTIHVYPEGSTYLQKWVPDMKFESAPFIFQSREHWAKFLETDVARGWIRQVKEKSGITIIGSPAEMMRGPYRVMVTKKPVKTLADVKGLKLRMHPDQLATDAWTYLGAEVRVLEWTAVYESIQRGIVESVNSPVALVESMKFFEVAPHIVRHDEYPQGIAFMTNAKAYEGLPKDLRAAVDRAYKDAGKYSTDLTMSITGESLKRMQAKGVTYSEPDLSEFIKKMQQFYAELDRQGKLPKGFVAAVNASRPRT
ncbi:MAG: TRAP transporter substrate-binding protein [Proteobacteria bacterium]|nr:TRAP transporter substrate-binding protein [Pseudomonadota bacterium]